MKKTIFIMLFGIMLATTNGLAEDNTPVVPYFTEGTTWRTTIYPIANGCDRFIDKCIVKYASRFLHFAEHIHDRRHARA